MWGITHKRLKQAAELAKNRSDIVIYTGGLGPTDDDLTKQTVAAVYNDTLEFSRTVHDKIRGYFNRIGVHMTDNNLKQAYVPQRGKYLDNGYGTAPGIVFIDGEKMAVLMPGVPREMKPMMENQVVPMLKKLVNGTIISRYVRVIGIGESPLEDKISILLQGENPTAALYAKEGEVTVRLTALAADSARANEMLDKLYRQLQSVIGDYIYGVDVENIETVLVNKLKNMGKTVATAESCTGGGLSARITSVAGASQVFSLGVCTYSDRQKQEILGVSRDDLEIYTAVSSQVVAAMAQGIRRKAGSDYAIATTGYAGPGGGTPQEPVGTVYIAVATENRTYVKKCSFSGDRARITHLACQNGLNLLRCVMDNIPAEGVRIIDVESDYEEDTEEQTTAQKGFFKGFTTMVFLILLSAVLARGYLWYKNSGMEIAGLPNISFDFSQIADTITGFFSREQVADVNALIIERSQKDFFRQGFERSTLKTVNRLQAQNPDVEGWLTFRYSKKEYAVYNNDTNEIHLLAPGNISDYSYISGFTEDNFIDLTDLNTVRDNSAFICFEDGSYTDYQIFSVGTFSRQDLAELTELTEKQEYIVRVRARSLFDVDVPVTDNDKIIVLLQNLGDEKYIAAFAVKGSRSSYPSVDIKNMAVYSDWYMEENNLTDENARDAAMYAQEVYDRDNWLLTPVVVETPGERPSTTPYAPDIDDENIEIDTDIDMEPQPTPEEPEEIEDWMTYTSVPGDVTDMDDILREVWEFEQGAGSEIEPEPEEKPQPGATATPLPDFDEDEEILTVTINGKEVSGPATLILSQIVAMEMTYTWEPEALKAQAVAAHSYLEYQYSRGVKAPAVAGRSSPNQKVIDAVSQVSDLVITVGGKPVYTPYTASAAGKTNPAGQVWGTHHSHLVSVESKYDYQSTNYEVQKIIPAAKMKEILDDRVGIDLDLSKADKWIKILSYTDGGYVRHMSVDGKTTYPKVNGQPRSITGWYFGSDILADAGYKLRSAAFDIKYSDGNFIITTRSYGHGVGLSQWGAQLYAKNEGWSYEKILNHYYTNVDIVKWK